MQRTSDPNGTGGGPEIVSDPGSDAVGTEANSPIPNAGRPRTTAGFSSHFHSRLSKKKLAVVLRIFAECAEPVVRPRIAVSTRCL